MVDAESQSFDIQDHQKIAFVTKITTDDIEKFKKAKLKRHREKLINRIPDKPQTTENFSPRKFYYDVTKIVDLQFEETSQINDDDNNYDSVTTSVITNSSYSVGSKNVIQDSVRSGESLVKYYSFNTSRYNSETEKCIAFWRAVRNQTDLKPIKCAQIKVHVQSDILNDNTNSRRNSDSEKCMWYNMLLELQKKKMDELALAAEFRKCKLCDREEPYSEFKKRQGRIYSQSELKDNEDILCLNHWSSKSKPRLADILPKVQDSECFNDSYNLKINETLNKEYKNMPLKLTEKLGKGNQNSLSKLSKPLVNENQNVVLNNGFHASPELLVKGSSVIADQQEDELECNNCSCSEAICHCNESKTSAFNNYDFSDSPITRFPEFDSQELKSCYATTSKMEKEGDDLHKKDAQKTQFQEKIRSSRQQLLSEQQMPSKCEVCNKTFCYCIEHSDQQTLKFLDQLQYQLKNVKKEKSCETDKQDDKGNKDLETKQFCIICNYNVCKCREHESRSQPKYFEFIEFHDNKKESVAVIPKLKDKKLLSETENFSNVLLQKTMSKEKFGNQEQKISTQTTTQLSSSVLLTTKYSSYEKAFTDMSDGKIKRTSKSVIILEPNHCGVVSEIKSSESHLPSYEDIFLESSSLEQSNKSKQKSKKTLKPVLWYSAKIPQQQEFFSLNSKMQ